jgi:hypothetical protein
MKIEHSSGPWMVEPKQDLGYPVVSHCGWNSRHDRRVICVARGYKDVNEDLKSIANARLISAAPEMLAALLDVEALLTKVAQDMNDPDFDMTQEAAPAWWLGNVGSARNKAIEAIRKAIGES